MLLDDRFGFDVLADAADRPYWIGRPIEIPRSRPLEFEGDADVGMELNGWPLSHVVKCLVIYHPDDPPDCANGRSGSCCACIRPAGETGHELLLEIIPPDRTCRSTSDGTARVASPPLRSRHQARLVEAGADRQRPRPGRNIVEVIEEHDPLCRGILMLGLSAPIPSSIASFKAAARFPLIKGFAVGRTIFHDVARDWLPRGRPRRRSGRSAWPSRLSDTGQGWRTARARLEDAAMTTSA